jgi:omega-6 fatty acid desaturase (delta-12 desaturase)
MTVLPQTIDARTRHEDVQLTDIRGSIPAACFEQRPAIAWFTLARVVGGFVLITALLLNLDLTLGASLLWQLPVLAVLWVLQGWNLLGLFVLGHDCGHRSFSRRPWVNRWVGHLCMSPLANAFHTWVVTHDHHHAWTQRRGEEVDWASHLKTRAEFAQTTWRTDLVVRLGYALPFGIFFWIITNTIRRGFLVRQQIGETKWRRERRRLAVSNAIMLTTMVVIYGGLFAWGGLWMVLMLYGIPAFIANVFGALVITVQHANPNTLFYSQDGWSPLRGQLVSTFDVRFPRWIEWMWCDINIHIPHHISANIPWYHLRAASAAVRASYPAYYQSRPFSVWQLSWFATTPFLHEVSADGYFEIERSASAEAMAAAAK